MQSGGPNYGAELGRRDGRISTKASVSNHLLLVDFNYKQLKAMFASHGLSEVHLIALSGAHTIGFSHCNQFFKRIYNYNNKTRIDPTLHQGYERQLQQMCPRDVDPRITVPLDPNTPLRFDNSYYKNTNKERDYWPRTKPYFPQENPKGLLMHLLQIVHCLNECLLQPLPSLAELELRRETKVKLGVIVE